MSLSHRFRTRKSILALVAAVLVGLTAVQAETETVQLKDGRTYKVQTKKGLPLNFESSQIRVRDFGLDIDQPKPPNEPGPTEGWWTLFADLKQRGNFIVTVTSINDPSVSTTFECTGPGKLFQMLFKSEEFPEFWEWAASPAIYAWLEDPEPSWHGFVLTFEDKDTHKKFEVTQWQRFGSTQKRTIQEVFRMIEEQSKKKP